VKIAGREKIKEFAAKHSNTRSGLSRWLDVVEKCSWQTFSELRKTFPSADYVKGQVVFNVAGNHVRLIALIDFDSRVILIKNVLRHEEYDEEKWKR